MASGKKCQQKEDRRLLKPGGKKAENGCPHNVVWFSWWIKTGRGLNLKKKSGFNRYEHIRKAEEFKRIFRSGKSFANDYTVIYILDRKDGEKPRVGWVLSKKTGKANCRIRTKRLIREVFRLNKKTIKDGIDMVILPRKKIIELEKYPEMENMLLGLWKEKRVLK